MKHGMKTVITAVAVIVGMTGLVSAKALTDGFMCRISKR